MTTHEFKHGFDAWKETYFEVVAHLMTTTAYSGSMSRTAYENGGRGELWSLATDLTDEFEDMYAQDYINGWEERDYFDIIDEFLREKEHEHKLVIRGLNPQK